MHGVEDAGKWLRRRGLLHYACESIPASSEVRFVTDACVPLRASIPCNENLETFVTFPKPCTADATRANPGAARVSATVARLREDTQRVAERIVADAQHARQLGAKAETFRRRASELDRHAHHAEELSRNWAVDASRAAAAEKRLVAEALEIIESRSSM